MKWSKDGKVCFDPVNHTYKLGETYLKSVSGLIKKYKKPFDSDRIATAYALKHDLDKDEVLASWEKERQESANNGTGVHRIFEDYILTGELKEDTAQFPKEKQAIEFIKDFFKTGRLIPIETELICYNEKLATQIDCISKNKKGEHFILDWKTNKRIDHISYKDQRMISPFTKYPDCNFYHYSLQVKLHKILCKEYDIKQSFIVHLLDYGYQVLETADIVVPEYIIK